jgi:plasmid stabilization system protein ParE
MTYWFHPEALAEYHSAAHHYKQVKPELGRDFRTTVEKAVAAILEHPTRFGPVERGIRRYLLKRFPYKIYFFHDAQKQEIAIYAVMHVRRDPDYWKGRLGTGS